MKKTGLIATALVLLVFVAGYGFHAFSADDKQSKKDMAASDKKKEQQNAATVNGKPITMSDYKAKIDQTKRRVEMTGRQVDEKDMDSLKKKALEELINTVLLEQEAQKRGIKADDAEVDAQLEALKKNTTPENFQKFLKQANMTESTFRGLFASEMVIRKLIEQDVAPKIVVTAEEVKAFYDGNPDLFKTPDMVRASHILVKVDKNATEEEKAKALEKIKGIQKRVQGGEDFAQVAKEVSDCPSKAQGGDLDFFTKDRMAPPFANAAFSMKPGDTSDIVETEFGYHIIRVTDRKEAGTLTFDEVKPRIEQHLRSEKISQEIPKYIETLKSKAKIAILIK
jgi:peptidyl-prolyl cis-trans isomerase C